MKSEYDTTEMTAATNEDRIGCLLENAAWRGRNETFDNERFRYIKVDFSDGGNEKIFGCWVGFFPIPRFSHKDSGEGGTFHSGCNNFVTFLVKRGMPGI